MRKNSAAIIVFLVLSAVWVALATAQGEPVRDCVEIMASKKLFVAMVDKDYPPYILQGRDGQLTGLSVDMAKDIAKELGISEGTSKSQLSRARVILQNLIQKK